MAFIQILSGSRADEVIELNPNASLIVGSASDAHIQVTDPDVVANHCQIYPAQDAFWLQDLGEGLTVLNTHRLAGTTEGLRPNDVFILGQTFMRFLAQRPAGGGGSGGGPGSDPGQREEIERLVAAGRKGEELTQALGEKLRDVKAKLETFRNQVGERDKEIAQLRGGRGGLESQVGGLEQQVKVLQQQLASAQTQSEASAESLRVLSTEVDATKNELAETRQTSKLARVDAKRLKLEMGMSDKEAKETLDEAIRAADDRVADSEDRAADAEAELASALARLEATHAALEALGVQRPGETKLGFGEAEKLSEVLGGLGLSAEVLGHLEAGLAAHVDREALRRFAGPQLTWVRPEAATKLAQNLASLRNRGETVDMAMSMGVEPGP